MATKTKKKTTGLAYKVNDCIVYPAHGVGRITGVEKETIAGIDMEVYVISFEQDKMTLRVPTAKADATGMRPLASGKVVQDALTTLKGKARIKRTMWSRRAQEYEAKINSGNLIQIAEVVRDLHRGEDQPEQSYSERQLYESALDRMVREVAAVEKIDRDSALAKLSKSLVRSTAAA
ncbi:MAG: CarD family transcriptional regulator [Maricaulaceae bacterium]